MLARAQLIGVHGQAHGAARLAPLEARFNEDFVQAFRFRLALHQARARYDHGQLDGIGHFVALRHFGSFAQVFSSDEGDLVVKVAVRRAKLRAAFTQELNGFT